MSKTAAFQLELFLDDAILGLERYGNSPAVDPYDNSIRTWLIAERLIEGGWIDPDRLH